jgi:hypothetical protein
LDVCRSCHVRNGVARRSDFLLDSDPGRDAERLIAAFQELGEELLLTPAEEEGREHDGDKRLRKGTEPYERWQAMMRSLASPQSCE